MSVCLLMAYSATAVRAASSRPILLSVRSGDARARNRTATGAGVLDMADRCHVDDETWTAFKSGIDRNITINEHIVGLIEADIDD